VTVTESAYPPLAAYCSATIWATGDIPDAEPPPESATESVSAMRPQLLILPFPFASVLPANTQPVPATLCVAIVGSCASPERNDKTYGVERWQFTETAEARLTGMLPMLIEAGEMRQVSTTVAETPNEAVAVDALAGLKAGISANELNATIRSPDLIDDALLILRISRIWSPIGNS